MEGLFQRVQKGICDRIPSKYSSELMQVRNFYSYYFYLDNLDMPLIKPDLEADDGTIINPSNLSKKYI